MKFLLTFKLSQDPLENFFAAIRSSCGLNNNPTCIQFKSSFQNLLCNSLNKSDNGNCYQDESISLVDLTNCSNQDFELDIKLEKILNNSDNTFTENVLIYMSGYIMRTIMDNEPCTFCYVYLKECDDRMSCPLIEKKTTGWSNKTTCRCCSGRKNCQ